MFLIQSYCLFRQSLWISLVLILSLFLFLWTTATTDCKTSDNENNSWASDNQFEKVLLNPLWSFICGLRIFVNNFWDNSRGVTCCWIWICICICRGICREIRVNCWINWLRWRHGNSIISIISSWLWDRAIFFSWLWIIIRQAYSIVLKSNNTFIILNSKTHLDVILSIFIMWCLIEYHVVFPHEVVSYHPGEEIANFWSEDARVALILLI